MFYHLAKAGDALSAFAEMSQWFAGQQIRNAAVRFLESSIL
jgi:hypothetical protein